jgi:hypothetical protein
VCVCVRARGSAQPSVQHNKPPLFSTQCSLFAQNVPEMLTETNVNFIPEQIKKKTEKGSHKHISGNGCCGV